MLSCIRSYEIAYPCLCLVVLYWYFQFISLWYFWKTDQGNFRISSLHVESYLLSKHEWDSHWHYFWKILCIHQELNLFDVKVFSVIAFVNQLQNLDVRTAEYCEWKQALSQSLVLGVLPKYQQDFSCMLIVFAHVIFQTLLVRSPWRGNTQIVVVCTWLFVV